MALDLNPDSQIAMCLRMSALTPYCPAKISIYEYICSELAGVGVGLGVEVGDGDGAIEGMGLGEGETEGKTEGVGLSVGTGDGSFTTSAVSITPEDFFVSSPKTNCLGKLARITNIPAGIDSNIAPSRK